MLFRSTVAESGLPGFAIEAWLGLFAPPNVPASLLARLSGEAKEMTDQVQMRQRMKTLSCTAGYLDAQAFGTYLAAESNKMRDLLGGKK